ncbi:adenylate/guanylate cyclase domain-containing protein [bacterium]|nr:adenylate/guanylate cyclase domain-containing protein [candidate division CSSED10-310 bacterium]
MNKFLVFDERYQMYRLPLGYSLGDLDTIRTIFGRQSGNASVALPVLPPQTDVINDFGDRGYLVFPPFELSVRMTAFMEKTIVHVRELKGKGYDYNHPDFKKYLEARDEIIGYIADRLENVIEQERRLGIFNLFWLVVTRIAVDSLNESLVKLNASQGTRFLMQPHVRSMLKQSLDQVYEKLKYKDELFRKTVPFYRSTVRTRMGASFNYMFVNDMLDIQLSLLENAIPPVDPLHMIEKLIVDENADYFITYKDFEAVYHSVKFWVDEAIASEDDWLCHVINHTLGMEMDVIRRMDSHIIVFEPKFIYTMQDRLRRIPVLRPGKGLTKKNLVTEIGEKIYDQVLVDYIKLARELQKTEIITFFRNTIRLMGTETWSGEDEKKEAAAVEDKITYNLDKGTIINDLRDVTILFIDLRASTELSSGTISSSELIKTLYAFFDPALDIIGYFGGQIRFFAGDAILATFSDQLPQDKRTINAVKSGIAVQLMLTRMVADKKLPLEGAGVGVHVGSLESAYIFRDENSKFNTVIGWSANVASRLSSGKSSSREKRADPLFRREINDLLQDILENTKNRITPNVREDIVNIFEGFTSEDSEHGISSRAYQKLPDTKEKPGFFRVNVISGILHNNGVALSDAALKDLQHHVTLTEKTWRESNQFVYRNEGDSQDIVFRPVGDAHLKGIQEAIMVWSAQPADTESRPNGRDNG